MTCGARRGVLVGLAAIFWAKPIAAPKWAAMASRGPEAAPGQVLVRVARGASPQTLQDLLARHGLAPLCSIPQLGVEVLSFPAARDAGEVLIAVRHHRHITWAEPNHLCRVALAEPNDPAYHEMLDGGWVQWPLHELDLRQAWSIYPGRFFTAADRPQDTPIVALIDTGVDPTHPDFANPGAAGADIAQGGQLMLSAARTFLSGQPSDLLPDARDEHGHGTHLAGIIAAATNNGVTAGGGIAGMGYPARLLPLKVTGANGVATHADVARAIVYAADQGASVILIGMAAPTWSATLQAAVDYAWSLGSLLIAPVGDGAGEQPMFPAACPHVFGVAATTEGGLIALYSGRGDHVALAAPGGDESTPIYSTLPTYACTLRTDLSTPAYGWIFGTSQAAAHATAAAAIYAGAAGILPETGDGARTLWQALQGSATALAFPDGWQESCGYGLVAPADLVAGEPPQELEPGALVGRVTDAQGAPIIGASVTAAADGLADPLTVTTAWPAGGYRIANLAPGTYRVTAQRDQASAVWEQAVVRPGCDSPGVDLVLSSPPADATLLAADIPAAAVRGYPVDISVALSNTGEATWTRAGGYVLAQAAGDRPLSAAPDHVDLGGEEEVVPGASATFTFSPIAPDQWGFYTTAWQMCQRGGVGPFGDIVRAVVSVTSFLDVPADHWAVAQIEAVQAAGVVQGYDGHLYHPDRVVSRDQMAAYLSRAIMGGDAGVPTGPAQPAFPDVPPGHWAYRYVECAYACGLTQGYPDGLYHPDETLDRAQMATFVARTVAGGDAGVPAGPPTPSFPDVNSDFWAYRYIEHLKSQGIVAGYPDGRYHPEYPCTRDQMAVYVQRAFRWPS